MTSYNEFSTPLFGFCRDCLIIQRDKRKRCIKCGSPRIVAHEELYRLSIAHIDCDAFYAAVEKRDKPGLRDKPVIIGGDKRSVVSTCCYIARMYGVRSAMPMFKALELCPHAVVIAPDMAKYVKVSNEIRQMMLELTPLVEQISIDEAFLDLHGTSKLHKSPPAFTLASLAKRVEDEIGISVSIGLSYCKYLAKIGSDIDKPRGFSLIGEKEALSFLSEKDIKIIMGVGKKMAAKLNNDGIFTIGQLQKMEEIDLMRRYGVMGQRLFRFSRGVDKRSVEPFSDMKSVSAERTFENDISKREDLIVVLRYLSELVSYRLKKNGIAGQTVVLKLKTKDFKLRTRNRHMADPTQIADRIFRVGEELLDHELDGTSFRLLGIGIQQLTGNEQADPIDLVDELASKKAAAEKAVDQLRDKFGYKIVETGFTFRLDSLKLSKEKFKNKR